MAPSQGLGESAIRARTRTFRLIASATIVGLAAGQAMPAARAQETSLPGVVTPNDGTAIAEWRTVDPPARVGRVAALSGDVSFHTRESDQWAPVAVNYPVAAGNALWVQPDATARLEIGASRIALGGGTELQVTVLEENAVVLTVPRGEAVLDVRQTAAGETWSVQTPRGLVTLAGAGRYAVMAGDVSTPTQVTVLNGAAQVTGPGVAIEARPGQTVTLTGTDPVQADLGAADPPPALIALLQDSTPPPPPQASGAIAPPPVVAQMPGGQDLSAYGTWEQTPDAGAVWYPQVASDWVPYRDGHWAYVQPWGWTWIDDAPWGFAPFHYGRWAQYGGRWGWVPVDVVVGGGPVYGPPIYAPALVTFFGIGAGVTLGAAFAAGSVGWWPLGPREPFRPWYRASPRYYQSVNRYAGVNITRNVTINNYVNRRAATVVPAGAMAASYPVNRYGRPYDARNPTAVRPMVGAPPLRPSIATAGITPHAARRMNLAPPPGGFAAQPRGPAPGPAIRTMPAVNAPVARPPLWDPRAGTPRVTSPGLPSHGGAVPRQPAPPVGGPAQNGPGRFQAQPGLGSPAGAAPYRGSPGAASGAPPGMRAPPAPSSFPRDVPLHQAQPAPSTTQPQAGRSGTFGGGPPPQVQSLRPQYRPPQTPSIPAPSSQFRGAPPPAQAPRSSSQLQAPPAQPQFRAPPAQPQFHAPPAQPQFHAPSARPQFHSPPAQPQFQARPAQPQFHAPQAQPARTAPPPQFHQPPQPRSSAPPPQHQPQQSHRRPGER
ncbi:MAG: DUF6600 domain-containing protein [Acetobacteraceae bacterium]